MGHRSCSLRPESARGRVMMALPVDVAGLCPRSGDVEAPPKPRSSLSSMAEAESEPLGRAERSFLWCLWQGLTACQSHSIKWHCDRSGAGGAVLLSGRSVERRSDGGHFGSVGWGACVRIKASGHLCIKRSCDLVGRCGDLVRVASWRRQGLGQARSMFAAGGGPRARRRSSGVGCPCLRLGSGEA